MPLFFLVWHHEVSIIFLRILDCEHMAWEWANWLALSCFIMSLGILWCGWSSPQWTLWLSHCTFFPYLWVVDPSREYTDYHFLDAIWPCVGPFMARRLSRRLWMTVSIFVDFLSRCSFGAALADILKSSCGCVLKGETSYGKTRNPALTCAPFCITEWALWCCIPQACRDTCSGDKVSAAHPNYSSLETMSDRRRSDVGVFSSQ